MAQVWLSVVVLRTHPSPPFTDCLRAPALSRHAASAAMVAQTSGDKDISAGCFEMPEWDIGRGSDAAASLEIWGADQDLEDELETMIKEGRLAEAQRRGALALLETNVVERDTESRNAHRLDGRIRFEEKGHKYYLREEQGEVEFPISVSGVWARYFRPFDAEATIARYYARWAADSGSKYFKFIEGLRRRGAPDLDIARQIKIM